jgi:hypothetical protein
MYVLSIDVGMQHLAHCLLLVDGDVAVIDWDVVDLTGSQKCFQCVKKATVKGAFGAACEKHRPSYKSAGMKKDALESCCTAHGLPLGTRAEMCKQLADYKKATTFVSTVVSRGRELCAAYARFDSYDIDVVLIENQMAAKMAVVQGMLTQFWIQRGTKTIESVSPVHKLKGLPKSKNYSERKKAAIDRTRVLMRRFHIDESFMDAHKKKDDLADTFLQAMWYLEKTQAIPTPSVK